MGTSICVVQARLGKRDHPHAYGDKNTHENFSANANGSSPRVWGQEFITVRIGKLKRIIPTRMGTSALINDCFLLVEDHPHAYGDKALVRQSKITGTGSSPRVWGQALITRYACQHLRIIPTRMGTSVGNLIDKYSI